MFDSSAIKIVILFLIVIVLWLNRCRLRYNIIKEISRVPGNSICYTLAHFYMFWGPPEFLWTRLREMQKLYPTTFKLWGGNRVLIFMKHPVDTEVWYLLQSML